MAQNQASRQAHNAAAAEFNAKAKVFNECKAIVSDARNLEENAHRAIQQVGGPPDKPHDPIAGLVTAVSTARDVAGGIENARQDLLDEAKRLTKIGRQFTDFANGHLARLGPGFQQTLTWAASVSTIGADVYRLKADQYHKLLGRLPQESLDIITAHPKVSSANISPNVGKTVNGVLRGLPYAGGLLTAFNEARGAVRGEQSWGKAAVDTGATLGGSALGGFVAGAGYGLAGGSITGPGMIVTGVLGGIVGGIAGQNAADFFVPE